MPEIVASPRRSKVASCERCEIAILPGSDETPFKTLHKIIHHPSPKLEVDARTLAAFCLFIFANTYVRFAQKNKHSGRHAPPSVSIVQTATTSIEHMRHAKHFADTPVVELSADVQENISLWLAFAFSTQLVNIATLC